MVRGPRVADRRESSEVVVRLPKTQALALERIADTGLKVEKALDRIVAPGAAEHALEALRDAIAGRKTPD